MSSLTSSYDRWGQELSSHLPSFPLIFVNCIISPFHSLTFILIFVLPWICAYCQPFCLSFHCHFLYVFWYVPQKGLIWTTILEFFHGQNCDLYTWKFLTQTLSSVLLQWLWSLNVPAEKSVASLIFPHINELTILSGCPAFWNPIILQGYSQCWPV